MCITIRISLLCDTTFNNKEPQSTVSNLTVSRSEHITPAGPALTSLHWLCVPDLISFKLAVMRYWSIHGTSLSYIQSCCTRVSNMTSNRRQRSSTSHRLDALHPFVSLQSARGRFRFLVPPSGTTCLSTLHLCRHSRFTDNNSRPFCFPVPMKTLSYDLCVTITIHHYCLDTCGPCNS